MNFIALRLIQILSDEDAFFILTAVIKRHKSICTYFLSLDENFCNPGFIKRQNYVFMQLLKKLIPSVYQQLYSQKMNSMLFIPSWFLTLFSSTLQPEQFFRFFECFLVKGYGFIYKMALTLIKVK